MTLQAFIAALSICVTCLGALLAITWRFASLATKLTLSSAKIEELGAELKLALEILARVPLIEQKVELVAGVIPKVAAMELTIARIVSEIAHLRENQQAYRQKHASFPDLEPAE